MSAGFLALLDDVAAIMAKAAANTKIVATSIDDIAAMTGAGAKGASAVVIDDIPVNAQAVTRFKIDPKNEIPLINAIEKGSMINKAIAVPLAIGLNSFAPFLLTPILAIGGAYLGYEGAEKVIHAIRIKLSKDHHDHEARPESATSQEEFEKNLIKGAIRTDLVMSIEIIFIALASIRDLFPNTGWILLTIALSIIAFLVTKIIYGLVKGLVRLDDLALHLDTTALDNKTGDLKRKLADFIIKTSPILMKTMSLIGTIAMLFISGELLSMHFTSIANIIHHLPPVMPALTHFLAFSCIGLLSGSLLVGIVKLGKKAHHKLTTRTDQTS